MKSKTADIVATLCEGWREIERLSRAASGEQDEDAEPEAVLPPLAEGQTFDLSLIHICRKARGTGRPAAMNMCFCLPSQRSITTIGKQ